MYKIPKFKKTSISSRVTDVGQSLETKIKRLMENNENLDEAPIIYTEKKEGVKAGHNVRTDKWEIAVDAMDKIHKIRHAKGEARGKVINMKTEQENNGTDNADV